MNKYAQVALLAAQYVKEGISPASAWEKASGEVFIPGSPSQKKGCPKNAFLGLYGGKGINAEYARKGLAYLQANGLANITEQYLWNIITEGNGKAYNSQMHVVMALFNAGLI